MVGGSIAPPCGATLLEGCLPLYCTPEKWHVCSTAVDSHLKQRQGAAVDAVGAGAPTLVCRRSGPTPTTQRPYGELVLPKSVAGGGAMIVAGRSLTRESSSTRRASSSAAAMAMRTSGPTCCTPMT